MVMKENSSRQNEYKEWVKFILIAVIIALFIKTFLFSTTYVVGTSMYPTLEEGDMLFVNKIKLKFLPLNRGDIIVLKAPDNPKRDYIKRIIGVEGDIVLIQDGKVYLNGKILKEDYIKDNISTEAYDECKWEIPKGYVFVLGDNRGASNDSRVFGLVPLDKVVGVANFRYYPFGEKFGKVY